jgi:Myb/SANT-like DNA-binding domain
MSSNQSPASAGNTSTSNSSARWKDNPQFIRVALEEYVECKLEGLQTDNGAFKGIVQTRVARKLKPDFNFDVTVKQLKSKIQDLKKRFSRFDYLRNKSGWGVDPDTGLLTASEEAWEEEIRVHPDSKWHRTNRLENLHLLEELFTNTIATGSLATGNTMSASERNDGNQLPADTAPDVPVDNPIPPSSTSVTPANPSQRERKDQSAYFTGESDQGSPIAM